MRRTFTILFLIGLCWPSWADAGQGDVADERQRLVGELGDRFGLVVYDPSGWDIADLRSLRQGAEALPISAWRSIDGPLTIEYIQRLCLFGMGRYNAQCPTFADGGQRFFIYDSPPIFGEGAVETLEILTVEEQRDLQVRRAIVHLAMVRLDRAFGWSQNLDWRAINGWPRRRGSPLNQDPWGYSRFLGMRSAHLDLVTFAEEFFVRPEDLLLEAAEESEFARERLQELDPDLTVTCQQFTKVRILGDRIRELDSQWEDPRRSLPHLQDGEPLCPAFQRWARPDLVDGFDIFLAAPTADQPESLYGHLLLHVRYRSDGRVRGEGFEPVYQFGAVTDTDVAPVDYFTRGLLGGFPTILELNSFRGVDRIFLQYQQRSLRRFSLQLTPEQSRHFLERIWEGERRIRYPYVFFPHNCASFLVDLLAPAVDPGLAQQQRRIVMPTDVLDMLADFENGEEGPLLVKRPDTLRSNREIADESVLRRRAIATSIANQVDDSQLVSALRSIARDLDSSDTNLRYQALERSLQVFDALLTDHPHLSEEAVDFLYESVLVERYFMQMAHFARRAVYARSAIEGREQTIEEQLDFRRQLYRHEDIEARLQAYNEFAAETEASIVAGRDREFTDQERAILDYEHLARQTYLTALQVQSELIDRHLPDWNGVEYLEARANAYAEEMRRIEAQSLGPSGRNRLVLGAGFDPQLASPTLEFSFSTMEDRLGELRSRGYRGSLESRVLSVDATIPFEPNALHNLQLDVVLFRYQSLERTYGPMRRGIMDSLGWSLDLRLVHDGRRDLMGSVEITGEILVPLWTGRDNVHHLVLHSGPAIRYDIHEEQATHFGAVAGIFGQLHLYGNYVNVVRFGLQTGHFVDLSPRWRFDVTARAESRHALFSLGQRPLVAIPFAEALWTTRDYRPDAPSDGFQTWRAGMKFELPF